MSVPMFPAAFTVISGSQWAVNGGHVNAMNWSALSSLPVWAQVDFFFVHDMMVMSGKLCEGLGIEDMQE